MARHLALTGEGEAVDDRHRGDAGLRQQVFLDPLHRRFRAVERGARRSLDVDGEEALVLQRQEALRQAHEGVGHACDEHEVDQHHPAGLLDEPRDAAAVTGGLPVHEVVEPAEDAALGVAVPLLDGFQHRGAERRSQREREQGREGDGGHHRDRELPVDDADRAGEERHRDEHGDQHQGDADDRSRDLAHGLAGRLLRGQPLLVHDALDVLDDDDGVVDEDADGEHHAEHGQHVHGEAREQHHRAGAEQSDRHDDGRDQGVADVLQEQEHHDEDEHHRLDQRVQHLLDRGIDRRRDVVGDVPLHRVGEELRQLLHLGADGLRGLDGVAVGRQRHRDARRRAAVEAGGELVVVAAEFDPGDVAQAHVGAVGIGPQHDGAERLRLGHLPLDDDGEVDGVALRARLRADGAGGDLHVLPADRLGHVGGVQRQAAQLVRVDPDPQRPLGRVEGRAADAGDAADLVDDVADEEVAQAHLVGLPVGGDQRDDVERRSGGLLHEDALLAHLRRQARLDALQPVLHLDAGIAGIGAGLEARGDLDDAERVGGRFEAQDVGRAIQLILDEARRAGVEILHRGAGIGGRERDRGGGDDRVLGDRQLRNRERAAQQNEQGDDPGEDRPVDEEASHEAR